MLNKKTLDLIKSFEGLRLKAYKDSVGVWTIGYGHTSAAGAPAVHAGLLLATEQQATDLLASDLKKYEAMVKRNVTVDLNENQYGALVSFTYNLGEGNLKSSTLLKKVNAKDFKGAALEFAKWDKAGGKVLAGLTRRRAAEAALFASPVTIQPVPVKVDVPVPETPKASPAPSTGFWDIVIKIVSGIFGGKT